MKILHKFKYLVVYVDVDSDTKNILQCILYGHVHAFRNVCDVSEAAATDMIYSHYTTVHVTETYQAGLIFFSRYCNIHAL